MENNDENRDELIIKQQREIEREICETSKLVSCLTEISLNDDYNDEIYLQKIKDLQSKSFAFAYLEYLSQNSQDYNSFKTLAQDSKEKLIKLGFPQFTLEDFHDTFMEVVKKFDPSEISPNKDMTEDLELTFNEQGYSDYVVVYLRLICSGKLQEEADFYQHFIEGDFTIEEFRHQEVEPMYKESDHIHIIALCSALDVCVRVEYMDRGDGGKIKAHDFPEGKDPKIFLLYRPGHYDILYPNN